MADITDRLQTMIISPTRCSSLPVELQMKILSFLIPTNTIFTPPRCALCDSRERHKAHQYLLGDREKLFSHRKPKPASESSLAVLTVSRKVSNQSLDLLYGTNCFLFHHLTNAMTFSDDIGEANQRRVKLLEFSWDHLYYDDYDVSRFKKLFPRYDGLRVLCGNGNENIFGTPPAMSDTGFSKEQYLLTKRLMLNIDSKCKVFYSPDMWYLDSITIIRADPRYFGTSSMRPPNMIWGHKTHEEVEVNLDEYRLKYEED